GPEKQKRDVAVRRAEYRFFCLALFAGERRLSRSEKKRSLSLSHSHSLSLPRRAEIGACLVASGLFFMLLGVLLLFDGGLLALGDALFLAGLALLIGVTRTAAVFARKDRAAGAACFFLGIALVFLRRPVAGILVEAVGFVNVFRAFFPAAVSFLQTLPVVGRIFSSPAVSRFCNQVRALAETPRAAFSRRLTALAVIRSLGRAASRDSPCRSGVGTGWE
ncbi:MAG: hypothetical protein BJ554DRAFT_2007, partial [Olpidium bornovanus]